MGLLGPAANTPANSNKLVNSVADQYLLRLGIATQIPKARHFSGSLAFRAEGLNSADVFGRSDGFRRPGYELLLEAGPVVLLQGAVVLVQRAGRPLSEPEAGSPTRAREGDATFPDYVFLGSYSVRFGKGHSKLQGPQPKPVVPSPPVNRITNAAVLGAGAGCGCGASWRCAVPCCATSGKRRAQSRAVPCGRTRVRAPTHVGRQCMARATMAPHVVTRHPAQARQAVPTAMPDVDVAGDALPVPSVLVEPPHPALEPIALVARNRQAVVLARVDDQLRVDAAALERLIHLFRRRRAAR
mgnify:CR=1 FL=1